MKKSNIIKDTIIFTTIILVLGFMLSGVKILTQKRIDEIKNKSLNAAYRQVCEEYSMGVDVTEKIINRLIVSRAKLLNCKIAYNDKNEQCGYVVMNEINGYGGSITTLIGFDNDGNITGIAYPENLQETPGIGMRVMENEFIDRFIKKNKESINDVDTLTGATISSTAVKESVSLAIDSVVKAMNIGE